jgi:hypothetical protein
MAAGIYNMKISVNNTKSLIVSKETIRVRFLIDRKPVEQAVKLYIKHTL